MRVPGILWLVLGLGVLAVTVPDRAVAAKDPLPKAQQQSRKLPAETGVKSKPRKPADEAPAKSRKISAAAEKKPRNPTSQARVKSRGISEKAGTSSPGRVAARDARPPKPGAAAKSRPAAVAGDRPRAADDSPGRLAPGIDAASGSIPAEASAAGAPAEISEEEAWKNYQAESAEAWKQYREKAISRAAYDAEIKRAWTAYALAAHKVTGQPSGYAGKTEALADLRTWLQLEFCNSTTARSSTRRHYGISGPTTGSGPAFAGLLDRFVQTVASEEEQGRMENELRNYGGRDTGDIGFRIETIQRRLNTREVRRAYEGSWCSRS